MPMGASSSKHPRVAAEIPEQMPPRANFINLEAGNPPLNPRNFDTGFNRNVKVKFPRFDGEFPRNWIRRCMVTA